MVSHLFCSKPCNVVHLKVHCRGTTVLFKIPSKYFFRCTSGTQIFKWINRPFYRYGGHIEFIRFKEYYGMSRGHSLSIYTRFSGKKRTSLYISREKGDHYYIQTRHNCLFFPLQSFSRKRKETLARKADVNTERIYRIVLTLPEHLMVLLKSN